MQSSLKNLVKKPPGTNQYYGRLGSGIRSSGRSLYKDRGPSGPGIAPRLSCRGYPGNPTRELDLRQKYYLEYVVASHDPERWNFSESTVLAKY